MSVYIVAKNDVPYHATFSEQEARQLYDSVLKSGRYRQVSMAVVPTSWEPRVILESVQFEDAIG